MPEDTQTLPTRHNLWLKILLPMGIGLLIFLGLYIATTSWYLQREIRRDLEQTVADVNASFQNLLDQRAQVMLVQLEQMANSTELQQLMLQQDRERLLAAAEPTFKHLLERLGISHCYFHNLDKSVFLRVHNPSRHGDIIDRETLARALETGESAHGIELGPLGTFTLRVVIPWRQNDQLLGYLELGEEVGLLLKKFFQLDKSELVLTIDKKFLDRQFWQVGTEMLAKKIADWELLPDRVIVQTSIPAMIPELVKVLKTQRADPSQDLQLDFAEKSYQGRAQPLLDSSGQTVGDFFILSDTTARLADYRKTVTAFSLLSLLTGGGFLFFAATILNNAQFQLKISDRQLAEEIAKAHATNLQLEKEIEERKTAENALNQIHNELERRVQERTEQLGLSLEQTQQARKQLTNIVTSVTDGLIVTDLKGTVKLLNPSAEQLFYCTGNDCVGRTLREIVRDPALLRQMEDALRQKTSDLRLEVFQMMPNRQKPIYLQARTSVITDQKDQPAGMIFLIHDITHEREVERIKSEFISTAVHELSTPLTAIMGYSELLLSEQKFRPEEQQEFLSIINEKSDFLARLVGDLLDISRIESGKPLDLQLGSYSVAELFERPIHHFRHFSENHPFVVVIADPEQVLPVDKEKIWQVMENLCSNAVKYSPEGGEVRVSGHPCEGGYQISISDQGVGLTDEQQSRVFEKFYRCNQSDTSVGGTGLGLTIVKSILEAHGGRIWIDSGLTQGTSVHFMLPNS